MTILSIVNISIVTFRFSELQKFKKLTSRVLIFGIQEVKKIDFKSSVFQNTQKIQFYRLDGYPDNGNYLKRKITKYIFACHHRD